MTIDDRAGRRQRRRDRSDDGRRHGHGGADRHGRADRVVVVVVVDVDVDIDGCAVAVDVDVRLRFVLTLTFLLTFRFALTLTFLFELAFLLTFVLVVRLRRARRVGVGRDGQAGGSDRDGQQAGHGKLVEMDSVHCFSPFTLPPGGGEFDLLRALGRHEGEGLVVEGRLQVPVQRRGVLRLGGQVQRRDDELARQRASCRSGSRLASPTPSWRKA